MMSKIKPIFTGTIENGRLKIHNRREFVEYIGNLKGEVELVIYPKGEKRTLPQNDFYWMYLGIIEQETGEDSNEMHEYFKRKFLTPKTIEVFGKSLLIPGSTTELKKPEFNHYIKKIENLTGILAPDPRRVYR